MSSVTSSPDDKLPAKLPDLSQRLPRLTPRRRLQSEQKAETPAPPTPALPPKLNLAGHKFFTPTRRILSTRDHELFLGSGAHNLIASFVFTLSDSVRNVTISGIKKSPAAADPVIITILSLLDEAGELVKRCPPLETGSRFGNPAFRDFLKLVDESLRSWHEKLGLVDPAAIAEVSSYLRNSFGDGMRIDYGSGHELNFVLWLLCLRQLDIIQDSTFPALALIILPRYLYLMRDIQSTYYLEPAGSHGVWGLDDYQFLPFLIGASQLVDHKHIRPLSIHNQMILEECSHDYLYLDQVQWVNSTKTVPGLRWHSPMLDDISAAKSWAKVEAGMRRMFLAEVLAKLPVAQHFLFGSLIPAPDGMSEDSADNHGDDTADTSSCATDPAHSHDGRGWGDSCGIKVPSAIGARREAFKGEGEHLRRIPFD
ncbi:hypothetical protein M433DRAFT_134617 [Acidomyces richmondensis BFW]|nr:MAG: hypothetical protein FE78DRAFT_70898 [Acidomyces sp. 'richmondensis']KYG45564.1 hypothetical protein M433DRAFT_134617 [Acidomyces richmondensis BFW]